SVIRPADANETRVAWELAIESKDKPTALVLTRQDVPVLPQTDELAIEGVRRGAYVLKEADDIEPDVLLLASGSEVQLILKASEVLKEEGISASVISMPSWDIFEAQSDEYKESVLPSKVTK